MTSPYSFLQLMSHIYGIVLYYLEPGEAFPLPTIMAHLSPGSIPLRGKLLRSPPQLHRTTIMAFEVTREKLKKKATHTGMDGTLYMIFMDTLWVFKEVTYFADITMPRWSKVEDPSLITDLTPLQHTTTV